MLFWIDCVLHRKTNQIFMMDELYIFTPEYLNKNGKAKFDYKKNINFSTYKTFEGQSIIPKTPLLSICFCLYFSIIWNVEFFTAKTPIYILTTHKTNINTINQTWNAIYIEADKKKFTKKIKKSWLTFIINTALGRTNTQCPRVSISVRQCFVASC